MSGLIFFIKGCPAQGQHVVTRVRVSSSVFVFSFSSYLCPPLRCCCQRKYQLRCLLGRWGRRSPLRPLPRAHGHCQRTDHHPEWGRCTHLAWSNNIRESVFYGLWNECNQWKLRWCVFMSSPETGGLAGRCVWVLSELAEPLSHTDCQFWSQSPHKDTAGR